MLTHEMVSVEFFYARFTFNVIDHVSQYPMMVASVPVLPSKKSEKKKSKQEEQLSIASPVPPSHLEWDSSGHCTIETNSPEMEVL